MKTCPVCDTDYPDQHNTCPTDGAVLIGAHDLAPGSLVRGKYRIVRKLGQGGMGVVYLADDILLGVRVALKFLAGDLGKDPRFIKRFRSEARAAYQLRHANVVEVKNLDQADDGTLFIAMEYVEGPSLRAELDTARGGFAVPRALEIARGITSGLAAAHAQGTVHRDIKPENILLVRTPDGQERPKILDFGIAAVAESATRVTRTRGFLLTPDYAAPEQWLEMPSNEIDGRTDLYALGCVLHEMLTGKTVFRSHNTEGWMKQHLEETPKPASALRPELANWQDLDALVLRLLAKDRKQRPKDAAELLGLLSAVAYLPLRTLLATEPEPRQATAGENSGSDERKSEKKPRVHAPVWVWVATVAMLIMAAFAAARIFGPQPSKAPRKTSAESTSAAQPPPVESGPSQKTSPKPPIQEPSPGEVEKQAVTLYHQKRYAEASPLFDRACDAGNSDACNLLGSMYQHRLGVARDYPRAVTLYTKSCNAGSATGCNNLGNMYEFADGVAEDAPRALALYTKSCDAGNADGCWNLGYMYEGEQGVAQDYRRAAALYTKSCDAGSASGCIYLGYMYHDGRGVTQDFHRAATLFTKACDAGIAEGCKWLGWDYRDGTGVEKDIEKAKQVLKRACHLDSSDCDLLKEIQ